MKNEISITLHLTDYLDKAFKTIPDNSFIHKGRCGIGGTTLEIEAERPSIIVVPLLSIITSKKTDYPDMFAVQGKVTVKKIAERLSQKLKNDKFIATPDSFENIILAAKSIGMLDYLQSSFFLLFDESHTAITDAFRERMLIPFKYFWDFDHKAMISATPFEFSNPKFQQLTHYRIRFFEPYIGEITLIDTDNIQGCVDYYIENQQFLNSKLFIWYNAVQEIAETIKRNKLKDSHVYCADKEQNFEKLPEELLMFQQHPKEGEFAAINFFTCKYFEGVDIKEENATVILVTDVNKAHTKVGISNKGVQAVGRLRSKPKEIIHITNNRKKHEMKTLTEFREDYELHTKVLIDFYNSYIDICTCAGKEPIPNASQQIDQFTDIDKTTLKAIKNDERLDQVLNELACNEQFNNINSIREAWEQSLYEVEMKPFAMQAIIYKRRSKAEKLKDLIEIIEDLEINKDKYKYGAAGNELSKLQIENKLAFEAYYHLGKTRLIELKFNENAINQELIIKHNINAESKLLIYLDSKIKIGDRKPLSEWQNILQYGYNLFQIRNPKTGLVKVAEAIQLEDPGRFKIAKSKDRLNNKLVNVFIITGKNFTVKMAA